MKLRSIASRAVVVTALVCAASHAAGAAPAPRIATLEDLKNAMAGALAGSHPAKHCNSIGSPDDGEPWTGTLQIGIDGRLVSPRGQVQLNMFDPRGEMLLQRRYPPYPPRTTEALFGFELKLRSQQQLFRLDSGPSASQVFLETGDDGGTGNAQKGVVCPEVDMSSARIAAADYDMNELLLPVFDTHGLVISGQCRAMGGDGPRPADRRASLKVGAEGVWIDGRLLPFGDRKRRVVEHSIGGRHGDGFLGGTYEWVDGSSVHLDRSVLSYGRLDAPFPDFAFHLPDMPEGLSYYCRVGATSFPGKP
ncbi:hypothetical protein [Ideonella sp.]|uniref:hypothetical protein n=1 Tax=Ideonella sp. TaxID=1929293 RepID=UPI0035ADA2CB